MVYAVVFCDGFMRFMQQFYETVLCCGLMPYFYAAVLCSSLMQQFFAAVLCSDFIPWFYAFFDESFTQ